MRYKAVLYLLGRLLFIIGFCLLIPVAVALYYQEPISVHHFLISAGCAFAVGLTFSFLFRKRKDEVLAVRDGFLLVTVAWIILSLFGAVPFYLSDHFATFMDAFFESVSGFTTTGASVLADVEILPRSLLFWRAFIQWIGGMGIIVLGIAILPQLAIGGMQLIKNETPGPVFEHLKPRIQQTALTLWKVYALVTGFEILLLWGQGMPLFDSFCHSFATLATGGFSTKNASIAAYSVPIQVTVGFFMIFGGTNFVLHYYVLRYFDWKKVWRDDEFKFFISLIVISIAVITWDLTYHHQAAVRQALNVSFFQVATVISATGFATADFDLWPNLSKGILFLLMFVGGCSGSASGGLKQIRLLILFRMCLQSLRKHIIPRSVITIKWNGRPVPEAVLSGISSFFLLWTMTFVFGTLILLAFNIDFITATSAVISCMSNVGPGLGSVGPMVNYAWMPDLVKLVLTVCMIIGRLEIFTVLVLFFPATWRR